MREYKSKWHKIVHAFMESGKDAIRLHEPHSPENAILSLKHYLDGKCLPIIYAKRGEYVFLIRTDCAEASVEDAVYGLYLEKENKS